MRTEQHRWYSHRLGRELGLVVYGHWGPPLLMFPTSGGDEWEMQNMGLIPALSDFIDGGKVKVFSVDINAKDSFYNKGAHPLHRSWMQRMYDEYLRQEVVPFIWSHCQSQTVPISTAGMSLGAYYAANALFKYPDVIKRCYAISGVYDMKRFMDGVYDENFYYNNPVDYLANLSDAWHYQHYASCDIRIVTGTGPYEHPESSYQLAGVLRAKGIPHSLDDWGAQGGHDWPYWKAMMREYLGRW